MRPEGCDGKDAGGAHVRAGGGLRGAEDALTTFIEVILNQELGEPFRRDAMKKPVVVAGINRADTRPQRPARAGIEFRSQIGAG